MSREQDLLTPSLYQGRVDRLRGRAAAGGLRAILVSDPANIFYLAGFWGYAEIRPVWLVVPAEGSCTLVVPRIEARAATLATWVKEVREWVEWTDPALPPHWSGPLVDVLRERECAAGRLGIEYGSITMNTLNVLRGSLPSAEFLDIDPLLTDMRGQKDSAELAILRGWVASRPPSWQGLGRQLPRGFRSMR